MIAVYPNHVSYPPLPTHNNNPWYFNGLYLYYFNQEEVNPQLYLLLIHNSFQMHISLNSSSF